MGPFLGFHVSLRGCAGTKHRHRGRFRGAFLEGCLAENLSRCLEDVVLIGLSWVKAVNEL